jgi:hypothetical protein
MVTKFFKILNDHGQDSPTYKFYKTGLNTYDDFIEVSPTTHSATLNSYRYSIFTTLDHIHNFYQYGGYLVEVELPVDDTDFQMTENKDGTLWQANKIILGTSYSLGTLETFSKFNLDVSKYSFESACSNGHVDILQWWKNSDANFKIDTTISITNASTEGRVNVLEWLKHSGLELEYNNCPICMACCRGHVDVLEWWKQSGLKLKYHSLDDKDLNTLSSASLHNHIDVLQWWKDSGLALDYDYNALIYASTWGKTRALQWWKDSGLELKFHSNNTMAINSSWDQVVVDWWHESGLKYVDPKV